jgi:hypothetical protein
MKLHSLLPYTDLVTNPHRTELTTAIYAKVDRDRLRELALPWPGGAS